MSQLPERVRALISSSALRNNYSRIRKLVPNQWLLPMVKANAYGHGADWAARELANERHLYGFGVATLQEGAELRAHLPKSSSHVSILVFSGATPWTEDTGRFCKRHGLTPVIARFEDWKSFQQQGWPARIPYELKFNTGMNRLGIHWTHATHIIGDLAKMRRGLPQGVCSHLARGDRPDVLLSRMQWERFAILRMLFSVLNDSIRFHLANSAAIWNHREWHLNDLTQVVRPGLSLYGIPPWAGAPTHGLKPALRLTAPVISVYRVYPGESVGYSSRYTVPKKPRTGRTLAVLAAGYGDGAHRSLTNRGTVWLGGRTRPVIGVVSMDLMTVEADARTRVGAEADLLGGRVDPWKQAAAAGTVPYEFLTSINPRVERIYD